MKPRLVAPAARPAPRGLAGDAVEGAEHAFQQQRDAEGQQQAVQVVELVQPAQHGFFDDDAEHADQQRREHQHDPVVQAEVG
jgi:hypothetical protein